MTGHLLCLSFFIASESSKVNFHPARAVLGQRALPGISEVTFHLFVYALLLGDRGERHRDLGLPDPPVADIMGICMA